MGTIADKLQAVVNSKAAIKAAIEAKGVADVGDVLSAYPDKIASISSGGAWTGHADEAGLKAIGWTDEDIAYYQKYGVNWNEEDDQYHLVPEDNKALYGVLTASNISAYKDRIVYLPKIDTSGKTDMTGMFQGCNIMVAIPMIDTSSATNMKNMFYQCYALVCIPQLSTSKSKSMQNMFKQCYSLSYVPVLDMSAGPAISQMYSDCYSLQAAPASDLSKCGSLDFMYSNCYSLTFIPPIVLRTSWSVNISNIFYKSNALVHCNIKNLMDSIELDDSPLFSKESLLYMIENAVPEEAITITLSAYSYGKFNDDPDIVAALSAQPLVSLASA